MKNEAEITNKFTKVIANLVLQSTKDVIPIVEGTRLEDLKLGAGYYQQSSLPGERGNCIILGHRETFFNNLGELEINDEITIETSDKDFTYRVIDTVIVDWNDKQIFKHTDNNKSQIILITCYPIKQTTSVDKKFLVIGELISL